jgi:cytochrome P450
MKGVYIPWGGGANMCPGRYYAKNELCLVVAMLLWVFDIEFSDIEAARKTKQSLAAFAIGTLSPASKNPIRLRRRRL